MLGEILVASQNQLDCFGLISDYAFQGPNNLYIVVREYLLFYSPIMRALLLSIHCGAIQTRPA